MPVHTRTRSVKARAQHSTSTCRTRNDTCNLYTRRAGGVWTVERSALRGTASWSEHEDLCLARLHSEFGSGRWNHIASSLPGRTRLDCATRMSEAQIGIAGSEALRMYASFLPRPTQQQRRLMFSRTMSVVMADAGAGPRVDPLEILAETMQSQNIARAPVLPRGVQAIEGIGGSMAAPQFDHGGLPSDEGRARERVSGHRVEINGCEAWTRMAGA